MDTSTDKPDNKTDKPDNKLRGIAGLYTESERKEIFRKYLIFLAWVEIGIFVVCWLYQLGVDGYDRYGPVEIPFPWRVYFLLAFLTPVAITFLLGIVIVGFNKYFTDVELNAAQTAAPFAGDKSAAGSPYSLYFDGVQPAAPSAGDKSGNFYKLHSLVNWFQHVPFLGLLLLLGVAVGFFYKLETFLSFFASVGEQSFRILLISLSILIAIACVFGLILIFFNYRLRKTSMEYQYKSEVAERLGLIILDDNTVLNKEGKLLVKGKRSKGVVPILPEETSQETEEKPQPSSGNVPAPADLKTS
jgi:hypothetical protein